MVLCRASPPPLLWSTAVLARDVFIEPSCVAGIFRLSQENQEGLLVGGCSATMAFQVFAVRTCLPHWAVATLWGSLMAPMKTRMVTASIETEWPPAVDSAMLLGNTQQDARPARRRH